MRWSSFLGSIFLLEACELNKTLAFMGILMLAVSIIGLAYSFSKTWTINNTGTVHNSGVEIYWYQNLSQPITLIDWGSLSAGASTSKTVYVHNPGNYPIAVSWAVANWNPAGASMYVLLTLPANQTLNGNQTLPAVLDLRIDNGVVGSNMTSYAFDYIVTGAEIP